MHQSLLGTYSHQGVSVLCVPVLCDEVALKGEENRCSEDAKSSGTIFYSKKEIYVQRRMFKM